MNVTVQTGIFLPVYAGQKLGCPSDEEFDMNFGLQASLTPKIRVKFPAV